MKSKFLVKIAFVLAIISMFSSFIKIGEASVLSKETATTSVVVYGDVNGDGKVTAGDARLVLLTSANLHTGIDLVHADIDNDGKITSIDARYILRASALLENLNCIRLGHNIKNGTCINCGYTEETTTVVETTTQEETTTTTPETTTRAPETTTKAPVTTTKTPEVTTSVSMNDLAYETFEKINEYRASLGLYPLKFNTELSKITAIRAQEASVRWSHTRPDGRDFWSVFGDYNKFNDVAVGEILAKVYEPKAERAVNGWINSPSHNAILVTTKYTEIGIAIYEADGKWFFAAHTI